MLCLLKWRSYRLGGWGSNRVLNLKGDKKIRGKKGKGKISRKTRVLKNTGKSVCIKCRLYMILRLL